MGATRVHSLVVPADEFDWLFVRNNVVLRGLQSYLGMATTFAVDAFGGVASLCAYFNSVRFHIPAKIGVVLKRLEAAQRQGHLDSTYNYHGSYHKAFDYDGDELTIQMQRFAFFR
jgi:hypothetical protein